MSAVNIAKAKATFSSLIERALEGEEIVITKHGEPVVMLVRAPGSQKKARLGTMAGTFKLPDDWDTPLTAEEFEELWGGR